MEGNGINATEVLKNEMAAALMHEVKNPICLIKMNVEQIRRESNSRLEKNITVIERELTRLNRIVSDYKSILSTNNTDRECIFLRELTEEIIEEYDISAVDKNIDFNIDCDDELTVIGDYNKICILFFNIIKNAVEAVENGGKINISMFKDGNFVKAEISDNGCGLPADIADKVGLPYVTGKKNGCGLGMVICRSIVEERGGRISIENRDEGGCVVRVCF